MSTASPNGPMPPTVCAVTKMPTSTSSAQATRRSKRSAAQARNSTGAKVSVELAPGTKVSTLAAESSAICARSSNLPPVQRFSVTTASGKSSSTAATCAANVVASDSPSGSRVTSREALAPPSTSMPPLTTAAPNSRTKSSWSISRGLIRPAWVTSSAAMTSAIASTTPCATREPHAPVGDEVAGRGREGQQRAQDQPPAHRGEREQDQPQPGRRPERRDRPAVGREVHRDGTGGDDPREQGERRLPSRGVDRRGVSPHQSRAPHLSRARFRHVSLYAPGTA